MQYAASMLYRNVCFERRGLEGRYCTLSFYAALASGCAQPPPESSSTQEWASNQPVIVPVGAAARVRFVRMLPRVLQVPIRSGSAPSADTTKSSATVCSHAGRVRTCGFDERETWVRVASCHSKSTPRKAMVHDKTSGWVKGVLS